jgi:hypothetical protein
MSTLKTNAIQTVAGKPILNSTGSILQVVQGTSSTTASTTNAYPSYINSGVTASITPLSSTSKISIIITCNMQNDAASGGIYGAIYKNGSILWNDGNLILYNSAGNTVISIGLSYLDSPGTTSSTTYAYYFCRYNTGTAYFYRGSIQLLEVSG